MLQCWLVLFLIALFGAASRADESVFAPDDAPLDERFLHPPASTRILPIIHAQQDAPVEQDRQLEQLLRRGFGGFAGNVSFDGYVDDESKWPAFLRGVKEAKRRGMSLWLYDECGYPSGSARDLTLKGHPEWAARGLLVTTTFTRGGMVSLTVPPGRLVLAAALPCKLGEVQLEGLQDLSSYVEGTLVRWNAPAGEWFVTAMTDDLIYDGTHAAISLAYKKPCIDLLTPEPTRRFLEVTHARYAGKLGNDLGQFFVSTFTDEPSLQNYWFQRMPYRVLPWSLTIEQEFLRRTGRALKPLLPALVADSGPEGARVRYEYWSTVGELVSENYFGQIQSWCHEHRLLSGGHLLMEESLVAHVPFYGHFFRCLRRLDAPSMDCLTSLPSQVPWDVARMVSSAADLEGRTVTMCEVSDHSQRYRPSGDERPIERVTEEEIRGTCNRLIWGGINTLTSYYVFDGLSDGQLRRINLHVGRCQTMLRGGNQVTDIAVLYPAESVWLRFLPATRGATDSPQASRIENVFDQVSTALYDANWDFRYVDADALLGAEVDEGTMMHRNLRWRILVFPGADTLPLDAWRKVKEFYRSGGVVVAVGARPKNSDDQFPSPEVVALAKEIYGDDETIGVTTNERGGIGVYVPHALSGLVPLVIDRLLERPVICESDSNAVRVTRRAIGGQEVYFVINDSHVPWSGELQFCDHGVTEKWDPSSGASKHLAEPRRQSLLLPPYGAMLYRSPRANVAQLTRRQPIDLRSLLAISREPLPPTPTPTVGHGEYVQADLKEDAQRGWQADATITKGETDTFLFVNFRYPRPLSLSSWKGLVLDVSVPEEQRANTELLVFLNAKNGDRYLGGTGQYLNESGTSQAYVMFQQFKPFGETRGAVELGEIASISVGWGGYLGELDERVRFSTGTPSVFGRAD
jgi:hypothetical protein